MVRLCFGSRSVKALRSRTTPWSRHAPLSTLTQQLVRRRRSSACTNRCVHANSAFPESVDEVEKLKAHSTMFAVQAVFALWYIVGHIVLTENDPLVFALARETLSAGALLALARSIEGEIKVRSRGDFIDIVILGLMCYAVVMGFMFALSDMPDVQVAVAQPLVPAISLGMSAAMGVEKLSYVSALGIVFSIGGAVAFTILNAAADGAGDAGHVFGYGALILELLAYAAQITYLPRLSKRYPPITLTAMYYTVATAASAVTLFVRERNDLATLPAQATMLLKPMVASTLLFAVLGPTIFCFTGMSYGSMKLKPSASSSYITLQPVLVALISLALFGTVLNSQEIAAGGVVMLGLYLSVIGNPSVDRAWHEYVSDLPNNVPQTLNEVAESSATAATAVKETVAETYGDVKSTVVETVEDVRSSVEDLVSSDKQ